MLTKSSQREREYDMKTLQTRKKAHGIEQKEEQQQQQQQQ
jgi:hypothetical protein